MSPSGLIFTISFFFAQILPASGQEAAWASPRASTSIDARFDSDISQPLRLRSDSSNTMYFRRPLSPPVFEILPVPVVQTDEVPALPVPSPTLTPWPSPSASPPPSAPTPTPVPTPTPTPIPAPSISPPEIKRTPLFPVPPPNPARAIPPPPVPEIVSFLPGGSGLAHSKMAMLEVEIWCEGSLSPQRPARRGRRFDLAYLIGTEPAFVRLQFHPLAAGKVVTVKQGPGVTIDPPGTELRVGPTGECVVSVALDGSFLQSDINIYCVGIRTRLPLSRASREIVEAQEAAAGGGR